MMIQKLHNQKGFSTVLTAFSVSLLILVLYGSVTTMLWYRDKNYIRLKESFKIVNVMEQAAQAVKDDWDRTAASNPTLITAHNIAGAMPALSPDPTCSATCAGMYGGVTPSLCYADSDGGKPYCLYGNANVLTQAKLELKILDPHDPPKSDVVARAKVVAQSYVMAFFDKLTGSKDPRAFSSKTFIASALWESVAQAASRIDSVGTLAPVCPSIAPGPFPHGCMVCGPNTGAMCGMIYACPLDFQGCAGYAGGANAVFAQEFYISPPGDTK
jgi:hypothetical protein